MSVDIAVIPVAGRGTRLLPLTKSQPKKMLPMGRKPVVQHVVEELTRCGIGRIPFITGPGKAAIENHFDAGTFENYFLAFTEFALADPLYGPALRSALEELLQIDLATSKHDHTVDRR